MRILLAPAGARSAGDLLDAARATHAAGLDGIALDAGHGPAPLVLAAALAPAVPDLLLAVEVPVGDRHPLELAEEAATVDLVSGGRLVLVARPAPGAEADYPEALDLLRTAWAARPFRHPGPRWPTPAAEPGEAQGLTRMTPAPLQPRLELWGAGAGLEVAARRGLGALDDGERPLEDLAAAWERAAAAVGPAGLGAPRARRARFADAAALRAELAQGREAFGQDWAVVSAPSEAAAEISRRVRPHLQLDRLPDGLAELWEGDPPPPGA